MPCWPGPAHLDQLFTPPKALSSPVLVAGRPPGLPTRWSHLPGATRLEVGRLGADDEVEVVLVDRPAVSSGPSARRRHIPSPSLRRT